jgi:hypothetical protein
MAIADREGVEPENLNPPLYSAVDTEALDALFEPTQTSQRDVGGAVTFRYQGYEVTVTSDDSIEIEDASAVTSQGVSGNQIDQFQQ